jgi:hypothetical protein
MTEVTTPVGSCFPSTMRAETVKDLSSSVLMVNRTRDPDAGFQVTSHIPRGS